MVAASGLYGTLFYGRVQVLLISKGRNCTCLFCSALCLHGLYTLSLLCAHGRLTCLGELEWVVDVGRYISKNCRGSLASSSLKALVSVARPMEIVASAA